MNASSKKYLVLVNSANRFDPEYMCGVELVELEGYYGVMRKVERETGKAFLALKCYLQEHLNIEIEADDAFRTIEEQQEIRDRSLQENGKEHTERYVARPYFSEHHTGLAIDYIVIRDGKRIEDTDDLQVYERIYRYLYQFGFILRYPVEKENITGIAYEPWHIRYVGKKYASKMYRNNLTLEEYHAILKHERSKVPSTVKIRNDFEQAVKREGYYRFDAISQELVKYVVCSEDPLFYRHHGYCLPNILRAAVRNAKEGTFVEGASTITQQLAKNLYLTEARNLRRKLTELIIAIKIEKALQKEEILEWYLNSIWFGMGNTGIEAACRYYFECTPGEAGRSEAIVLAAIMPAPGEYNPVMHRSMFSRSREVILRRLTDRGVLSEEQCASERQYFHPVWERRGQCV